MRDASVHGREIFFLSHPVELVEHALVNALTDAVRLLAPGLAQESSSRLLR